MSFVTSLNPLRSAFRRLRVSAVFGVLALGLFANRGLGQDAVLVTLLSNPTNNQVFGAPANIYVHVRMADTNLVQSVWYYSGSTNIGYVTNTTAVLVTSVTAGNPFPITWSNVVAGAYALTVVVRDHAGNMATTAPVNITVTNPVVHPELYIYSPTNNSVFPSPANLTLYARAVETGGTVATVRFFTNNVSLGVVSNSSVMVFTNISSEPLFPLGWSNIVTGTYALKAVATDTQGYTATSTVVNITVTNILPPKIPFVVSFWYPTNRETFGAPATVVVHALVSDSNVVRTVEYFANSLSIGTVTNISNVLLTNLTSESPFYMAWSNVLTGSYVLTAVATDLQGNTATSSVVNITVTNIPPPNVPFSVSFAYPTNGQAFTGPATVGVHAAVADSNVVETVQYFANNLSIGLVTNAAGVLLTNLTQSNPFFLAWSNVTAGSYALTALATDSQGHTATSGVVNITVTNVPPPYIPFIVNLAYPTNGETYSNLASVVVRALVADSNVVRMVQYFANGNVFGVNTNTGSTPLTNVLENSPFILVWSNVTYGSYALTALATDTQGNMATSAVVNIDVLPPPAPVIVRQPAGSTNTAGSLVLFSVEASGSGPLSYQWEFQGNNVNGANAYVYSLTNAQPANSGNYQVIVGNGGGSVTSSVAVLSIFIPTTNRPSLSITNPATTAPLQVSNATYTMLGTAGDKLAVAGVYYSLNQTGWSNAVTANGWTNWSAPATLSPGTNTFAAYAEDTSGNFSLTNTVRLVYVVSATLQVHTNGLGILSPNDNGALLAVGKNYSITAAARTGFVFTNWTVATNWSGGQLTNKPTVLFAMTPDLTLTANFVEVTKPVLTITNLGTLLRISNLVLNVLGTASDNLLVTNVWCEVNSNGWVMAVSTNNFRNWAATNLSLSAGTNVVRVFALNEGGLDSLTNTVTVIVTNAVPKLKVGVRAQVVPGEPAVSIANAHMTSGGLAFSLLIIGGATGVVQVSTNLTDWETVTNFAGTNTTIGFCDPAATNANCRFYRVGP